MQTCWFPCSNTEFLDFFMLNQASERIFRTNLSSFLWVDMRNDEFGLVFMIKNAFFDWIYPQRGFSILARESMTQFQQAKKRERNENSVDPYNIMYESASAPRARERDCVKTCTWADHWRRRWVCCCWSWWTCLSLFLYNNIFTNFQFNIPTKKFPKFSKFGNFLNAFSVVK